MCTVGVEVSEPEAVPEKDKLSALLYFRSECEAIQGERGEVRGEA